MKKFSGTKIKYYPAESVEGTKIINKNLSKEFGFKIAVDWSKCMKGGHTHNHVYNKCHKHIFRSKQARKKVDREDIMKNQDRTCWTCAHCNLACRLDSVGSGDSIYMCTEHSRGVHESDTCDKWVQHRRRV